MALYCVVLVSKEEKESYSVGIRLPEDDGRIRGKGTIAPVDSDSDSDSDSSTTSDSSDSDSDDDVNSDVLDSLLAKARQNARAKAAQPAGTDGGEEEFIHLGSDDEDGAKKEPCVFSRLHA